MFKMIAVMCILVWPDDVMTSELKCTTHYEDPPRTFISQHACELAAYDKLEFTLDVFAQANVDYESFQIHCEGSQDS